MKTRTGKTANNIAGLHQDVTEGSSSGMRKNLDRDVP